MSLRLDVHEDADLEMNEAAAYYDRESASLGDVFLDAVAVGFKTYPRASRVRSGTPRRRQEACPA